MGIAFISFYFLVLLVPSVFGIHRYYLVYLYYRTRSRKPQAPSFESLSKSLNLPIVTVQLPIYNERYVAPRLIRAISEFDYPQDKLEIQILDDSTDDTVDIVAQEVEIYRKRGFDIHHVRRGSREGFKAGALNVGLEQSKGEFLAVFDADFMPSSDFLQKTIPHFFAQDGKQVGMVQTRWEHINRNFSLLTQAQSILLDGHFIIEHTARSRGGCFFNFNGTAGVWRKECIVDAGGWSGETLTEDIDLSYRAQMVGWRFVYLEDVVAPAELPVDVNALKTQQHRWAKGSVQVAKKLLPQLLRGNYPFRVKMESFFHLAANFNYFLIAVVSLLMPFSLYIRHLFGWHGFIWIDLSFFLSATWSVSVFYYHSQKRVHQSFWRRIKYIPFSLALGIGLCVNNSLAVVEGLMNKGGEFKRTPKYAVTNPGDSWKEKSYRGKFNMVSVVEMFLTVHFSIAFFYAVSEKMYFSLPFVALFDIGFLYTAILSVVQSRTSSQFFPESQIVSLASTTPTQIS